MRFIATARATPNRRYEQEQGVLIGGAINVDWEDITVDEAGHLIVADVGNNYNDRRDLVLYYLDEPAPTAGRTVFRKKIFFRYPEQRQFPRSERRIQLRLRGDFHRA